jgi:protein NirF
MHLRPSADGAKLYISSYFESRVKFLETGGWKVSGGADVPTPSGIFIVR